MKKKLEGMIAAAFTPMNEKGDLALEIIGTLAHLYEKNDVNGVFIAGSTGEGVSLTFAEKKELMIAWGKMANPGLSKTFMLGGTCLRDMQYLAECAQDNNMDAISILPPYYFKPADVEQVVDFCKLVAQAAPDLPFYYYHIPGLTNGRYPMPEFLKLAEKRIPNLGGIKFSAPELMDFHDCCTYKNGKYQLLWGIDEALLSGLVVGANGEVGSTYNYAAPLYHKIITAYKAGNIGEAEKWQRSAVKMVKLLIKYGGVAAGKAFMKIIGVDCGWFRPPIQELSDRQLKELEAELEEIGFFEFCSKL